LNFVWYRTWKWFTIGVAAAPAGQWRWHGTSTRAWRVSSANSSFVTIRFPSACSSWSVCGRILACLLQSTACVASRRRGAVIPSDAGRSHPRYRGHRESRASPGDCAPGSGAPGLVLLNGIRSQRIFGTFLYCDHYKHKQRLPGLSVQSDPDPYFVVFVEDKGTELITGICSGSIGVSVASRDGNCSVGDGKFLTDSVVESPGLPGCVATQPTS